ncbi:MAG TPA: hypothetical protein VMX76_04090, partial [Nevskiaceae bacterium]|nr:hypothetical protein [Nevskiaceae bacterium]
MNDLSKKLTKKNIDAYQKRLGQLELSPSTIKRRISSIRKFCHWAAGESYLEANPFAPKPVREAILMRDRKKLSLSNLYKTYTSLSITKYLHYAILIILCAALGFGAYDQFFRKAEEPLAYPTSLKPPKRYLSFQGRLTDSSNNPISSKTGFTFYLYNVGTGGTALWTGACDIIPDQDGIFSVLLGLDCPPEIDTSVFTENDEIWLEIKVVDETLDPRIQIATVAYALNAETLQGYPPGTDINRIPYIDNTGDIIIAAASPSIDASTSSDEFAIKGKSLSISTISDGNITLAPNGAGVLNLTLSAPTGHAINAIDAQLGTSGQKEENTLYYGKVANDNANLNLLKLEAGADAVPKFTIDASGNASASGYLKALATGSYFTGDITVSGGDIIGVSSVSLDIGEASPNYITSSVGFAVGGTTTYYFDSSGHINANNITGAGTLNINGGGTHDIAGTLNLSGNALTSSGTLNINATSGQDVNFDSNTLFVDASENRVGIGTTSPTMELDIAGDATISGTLSLGPNIPGDVGTCTAGSAGKLYYNGVENKVYYCDGSTWTELGAGASGLWTDQTTYINPSTITSGSFRVYDNSGLAIGYTADPGQNSVIISGNVGIGTSDPSYKLDVNGNINIGGSATIGSIPLVADNYRVLTSASAGSGTVKYIDTTSWDKDTDDDYSAWILSGDAGP